MSANIPPSKFDVAVIGGGSAGYAAARTAAAAGLQCVLLEGAPELGGLCILRGCMPTKALLYASEVLHLARSGRTWGLQVERAGFDWGAVMARKDAIIGEFADYRRQHLNGGRFQLIREQARFLDPHTLALGNGEPLRAEHIVVATGSRVSPPPLPSLQEIGYLTSDDALTLNRLPESLIVLGAGPVGIELAQFFARLDVRVTVIQRSPRVLSQFDEDASAALEGALRREGIRLETGTRLVDARRTKSGKAITVDKAGEPVTLEAEEVLVALGRRPNLSGLNLEAAGVQLVRDRIETNEWMQTSVPHIYAAGDCTGPHEIVHLAVTQGELAAHNIGFPASRRRMDYRLLISVVFTEPQVAFVGLTESEARKEQRAYRMAQYPFDDHGKSIIMNARDGFVKLLADPSSGEILGGCCVGPQGGELIHEIVVAMAGRMTVHQFVAIPHYHPTLSEIWTYPAEELALQIPGRAT
jgi:pyruvate/2-oxoglutarate dehydrogenase complex dihydrolipoamide dehydrogenase (E3) component